MKLLMLGITLGLAALWGGSYGLHVFPPETTWQSFPIFVTGFFMFIIGLILIIKGITNE